MIRLKVCGMREEANIKSVAALKPDYMGFIFYPKSRRFVGSNIQLPATPGVRRVGVFVDDTVESIVTKVKAHDLDAVQLHGAESVEQCIQLKHHNITVIKALGIDSKTSFAISAAYSDSVDFLLFDTKVDGQMGGTGRKFDWRLLNAYQSTTPFFLSGGITPEDVEQIAACSHPALYAIDVNSGVEADVAFKDVNKIRQIQESLKNIKTV